MECPECGYKTSVQDSRPYMGTRYRKRLCVSCGLIFWTVEDIADPAEVAEMEAVKRMGTRDKKGKKT